MDSSPFVVRYLSFGDQDYANEAITQTVLDQLLKQVRAGSLSSFLLSMDEYGEDDGDFLSGDIERGWVALAFNTWDEEGEAHMYQPINQACSDSGDRACGYWRADSGFEAQRPGRPASGRRVRAAFCQNRGDVSRSPVGRI